jgi:hypothetical protein
LLNYFFMVLQTSQIITLVEEGDRRCGAPGAAEPMEAPDRPLERIPHIDSSDSDEDDDDLPPSHPPPPPPGMCIYICGMGVFKVVVYSTVGVKTNAALKGH